jgi:hypothetical protein
MVAMKKLLFLLCGSGVLLGAAELAAVKTVYVMPMSRGLDQYLASRLTEEHIFQVVTDPKLADAVLTDRIGEGFQIRLESFSPKPDPEPVAKPAKPVKPAKDEAEDKQDSQSNLAGAFSDTVNKLDNPGTNSAFGRGKGTIFLVEAKSREVVWSTFDPPKSNNLKDLNHTASDIVSRLKKDLNPKSK